MKLTDNQDRFAIECVTNGMNQNKAYREVYNTSKMKDSTISREAFRVRNNPKVATRIKELRMVTYQTDIISIKERKKILSDLALYGDIKSIDILNKMDGVYDQKEVEEKEEIKVTYKVVS